MHAYPGRSPACRTLGDLRRTGWQRRGGIDAGLLEVTAMPVAGGTPSAGPLW